MAANEKEAYFALIAARDPEIRALLDQGFVFVTNAFKVGEGPPGLKARTDRDHVRRLQQEGYQVAVSAAYDEHGHPQLEQWHTVVERMAAATPAAGAGATERPGAGEGATALHASADVFGDARLISPHISWIETLYFSHF